MRSLGGTVTALTEGSIGVSTVERKRLHHPFMQNLDNHRDPPLCLLLP